MNIETPGRFQRGRRASWRNRLLGSERFQSLAARVPILRSRVRAEGEAMMDLVAGFAHAQVLMALVELGVLEELQLGPLRSDQLSGVTRGPPERMEVLLRAGVALGILRERRNGRYDLSLRGASLLGVPGLLDMIRHHKVFYRDLAEPAAFFRGETETELANFWPYVFGAGERFAAADAERYSTLMARSQGLVAQDTLATVSLKDVNRIMDVGGGSGAFLTQVGSKYRNIAMTLFDLPQVVPAAEERFAQQGMAQRLSIVPGSFRHDALPKDADCISLIRVCYDHSDATVRDLLSKVFDALPAGGRLLISEPMTGGTQPTRAGDVYFQLYTLAMRTGRTRSQAELGRLLGNVGFRDIRLPKPRRAFITSVVTARR